MSGTRLLPLYPKPQVYGERASRPTYPPYPFKLMDRRAMLGKRKQVNFGRPFETPSPHINFQTLRG